MPFSNCGRLFAKYAHLLHIENGSILVFGLLLTAQFIGVFYLLWKGDTDVFLLLVT